MMMAGSQPNYRQEIRGLLRDPSCTSTPGSNLNANLVDFGGAAGAVDSTNSSEKQWNRLSRLHPQLQQQHFKNLWKHYLYELQQNAPTPKRVICRYVISSRPSYYGREFHGIMTRDEADLLLLEEDGEDGRYLIRESARTKGQMTLSLRFNGMTKNFRLYHEAGKHYVNELKRFDTLHDLVADGLITLYVELHASDYIANLANQCRYEESPYMTLHKGRLAAGQPPGAVVGGAGQVQAQYANVGQHFGAVSAGNKPTPSSAANRRSATMFDAIRPISNDDPVDVMPPHSATTNLSHLHRHQTINVQAFEKAHNFKTHTFIGSPWCDFCGNFIWGLIGQGVRCDDCGFGAHRKCSELVPNDCCPDLRHVRRIFGIDLTTFVKANNSLRPFVVDLCIAEVERRGLRTEGLYRACGSNDEIESLKNRFEVEWENTETYLRTVEDVHVITGLLKLYLRLLPIPLITFDAYQHFVDAAKKPNQEQAINGLREAANRLPPAHYQTLRYLIIHLNRLTAYEDYNLMSAKNLGLIFGQTLIYTPNIPMMFQMSCWEIESKTIELLIIFYNKIFVKYLLELMLFSGFPTNNFLIKAGPLVPETKKESYFRIQNLFFGGKILFFTKKISFLWLSTENLEKKLI